MAALCSLLACASLPLCFGCTQALTLTLTVTLTLTLTLTRRQPRPEYQDEFLEQEAAARQQRHAEGGEDEEEEGGVGSLERQMDELLYAKDPSRVRLEASRAAPRPECVPRVLGEEEAATP